MKTREEIELIAAAPDLLAAAEEAYSAIREYDFLYHKADGVTEQRQAVFAVAANLEAAIKKAKGQMKTREEIMKEYYLRMHTNHETWLEVDASNRAWRDAALAELDDPA